MDDGGWVSTDPDWSPADRLVLDRLDLLDEVVHPIRGAIVRRLRRPMTVGELADDLAVPVTRLYHHVHRLDGAGLIRVEATRKVGGVVERRYRAVARRFELDPERYRDAPPGDVARALGSLFDVSRTALEREIELGALDTDDLDDRAAITLAELRLTPARRRALLERLGALVEEFADDANVPDTDAAQDRLDDDPTSEPGNDGAAEGAPPAAPAAPFRLFVAAFPLTP